METQHKFEAPTLAEVLAKVQTQLGAGAKIINAQRVRSGGMLGFFQNEHFEVIATSPPAEAPVMPEAPPDQPVSLLSLAESVNAAESGYEIPGATVSPTMRIPLAPTNETSTVTSAIQNAETDNPFAAIMAHVQAETASRSFDDFPPTEADSLTEAEDVANTVEPEDVVDETPPNTDFDFKSTTDSDGNSEDESDDVTLIDTNSDAESDILAEETPEILDLSATERDPDILTDEELDAYFALEPPAIDPLTETFTPPREYQPHSDHDLDALFNLEIVEDDPIPWTPPIEYRSHTDRDLDSLFNLAPEINEPADDFFTPPVEYRAHTDLDLDALFNLAPIEDDPIPWTPPEEAPLPGPVILDMPTVLPPSRKRRWSDYLSLGLPLQYLPTRDESLEAAFTRQLPALPDVSPSAGSIICVAGERNAATAYAHLLAAHYRSEIALATAKVARTPRMQIIRKPEDANNLRRTWRRRQQPTIVVLVDERTPESHQWGRAILAELEPVLTYGVVDASRKTEDLSAWSYALGGIDALAVDGLDNTLTPAAILANEIPIASIDGTAATASAWTEYLLQRTQYATTQTPASTQKRRDSTPTKTKTVTDEVPSTHSRRRKSTKTATTATRASRKRASHA